MFKLADSTRDGTIAEGTAKGHGWKATWRIWIDAHMGKVYAGLVGFRRWTVGTLSTSEHAAGIATYHGVNIEGWDGYYAVVAPNVTRIVVTLNTGQRLTEHPVAAAGHRWVGILPPIDLEIMTETAYSGCTELGHMVNWPTGHMA